jgi:uncharacterized membrane protein YjjB (DUF3815 family)
VLYVGVIALIGNELRQLLYDIGVPLPLATFLGALAMVPGVYALETLVYFDRREILQGLSAGVLVGFVVDSIAFGLAAARFISQPEWAQGITRLWRPFHRLQAKLLREKCWWI